MCGTQLCIECSIKVKLRCNTRALTVHSNKIKKSCVNGTPYSVNLCRYELYRILPGIIIMFVVVFALAGRLLPRQQFAHLSAICGWLLLAVTVITADLI